MDATEQEKKELQKKVNALAKLALEGDSVAKRDLRLLIQNNSYVASLVRKLRRKIDLELARKSKKKKSKGAHARGSVMHGLAGKTSGRNWRTTK